MCHPRIKGVKLLSAFFLNFRRKISRNEALDVSFLTNLLSRWFTVSQIFRLTDKCWDWEHLRVWLIGLRVAESASPSMSASISLVISLGLGIARSERPVKLACTNYENYLRFKDFDWPPENIKRFKIEPKNTWEKDILVTFWKIVFFAGHLIFA